MSSFDERAATWDNEGNIARASRVAEAIRAAVPLAPSMRVFEYGAGTGLVTQALADAIGPATLADSSGGMRDVMTAKVAGGALPEGTRVWDLDLSAGTVPDDRFELIVTVLTMHHIEDLTVVLGAFATMLAPGGYLCIVDLDAEDGSFHGEGFHGHHGFERDALAADLRTAGFATVEFSEAGAITREDGDYSMFLATARVAG